MPKRGNTLGTPLRGAGRSRAPVLTILAVRDPARATGAAPRSANGHAAERRSLHDVVAAPPDGAPPLTLDELLTGWLTSLGRSLEPDSFAEYGDYAKHIDRMCRAQQAAECICRKLDTRLADWGSRHVDDDSGDECGGAAPSPDARRD